MSAANTFLPIVHLNSPLPPPPRQALETSPHLHLDRVPVATLSRNVSEPYADALADAAVARTVSLLRKGRASLPTSQAVNQSEAHTSPSLLTLITEPVDLSSSKSSTTTPAHKGIRFHPRLEHVKLLCAEQKPLPVSRDGSPTDTSGMESEFPSFIYSRGDDFKDGSSSCAESTCRRPYHWLKIRVMSLSRTSS